MEEPNNDWRLIVGVLVGVAAVLAVAAFLLWVVFYNDLAQPVSLPSTTGTGFQAQRRGSTETTLVISSAARSVGYATPSGAFVSLAPRV